MLIALSKGLKQRRNDKRNGAPFVRSESVSGAPFSKLEWERDRCSIWRAGAGAGAAAGAGAGAEAGAEAGAGAGAELLLSVPRC